MPCQNISQMPSTAKGQINEELNYTEEEAYISDDEDDSEVACDTLNTNYRELANFSILQGDLED